MIDQIEIYFDSLIKEFEKNRQIHVDYKGEDNKEYHQDRIFRLTWQIEFMKLHKEKLTKMFKKEETTGGETKSDD